MEELRSLVSQVAEIVYEAERIEDVVASLGVLSSLVLGRPSLADSLRRPRDDSKLCELEKLADKTKELLSGEALRRKFYQCGLFSCVSKLLMSKVAPDWLACFTAAEQDAVFYAFFQSAPPSEAILDLVPAMSQGNRSEDEHDTIVLVQVERVLVDVLVESSGIRKMCQEIAELQLPEHRSNVFRMAQLVASIPDRAGTRSPASLRAPMFVASAVAQICEGPCFGGGSCLFVSELLGKLCRRGHADVVATEVLTHLLQFIRGGEAEEADGHFLHLVVGSMQDAHALEKLLEALLLQMHKCILSDFEAYKVLLLFLGNPSSLKPTIRGVLTNRFLLLKSFPFPVLKWILDFLVFQQPEACASGLPVQDVQKDLVRTLAESWAEVNYIQSATVAQQTYLTAALGISLKAMQKEDVSTTDDLLKCLLDGISRRLDSPLPHVRRTAKQIALAFSSVVTPERPLLLDDEDSIDELSKWDISGQRSETFVSVTEPEEPRVVKPMKKTSVKPLRVDPDAVADLSKPAMGSLLDDNDDSDEESEAEGSLRPYDMSDDEFDLDKSKYPSQLAECANDLRKDDYDAVERALEVCEKLVRFMPDELGYSSSDLAHALVHVRCSSLAVEGEEETAEAKRRGALVALLACSPLETASVLTKELYSAHVDVSQRLMILDVLSEAARELANGTNDNTARTAGPWKEVDCPAPGNSMLSWCQTFERELPPKAGQRQVGRSRRWANRSLQLRKQNWGADASTGARKNKFAPVAAAFMLPVMRDFDKRSHGVDFLGRDYLVLGRLIQMLGICMESVAFHTEAATLGAALLDMLRTRAIANHPEPYVRRAVLFAVSRVLVALHPSQVVGGLSQAGSSSLEEGLDWAREWAARVAANDPDMDSSKMAVACLHLHAEVALEASRSAKASSSRSPLILAL